MSQSQDGAAPQGRDADLTECDREPIHTPGSIQPHGCVVVCSARDWTVSHVSRNIDAFFGVSHGDAIGAPAVELFGPDGLHTLRNLLQFAQSSESGERFFNIRSADWRRAYDVAMHQRDASVLIEFEDHPRSNAMDPLLLVKNVMARLQGAGDLIDFCQIAARHLRAITGFSRVMVYRFNPDGSGEVVAESVTSALQPYLGLRYPASDIPKQARALYVKNPIRLIADVDAEPSPIEPPRDLDGAPVDLSYAGLRSVSPIHLEYLRNMGVGASMSLSIVQGGELWGLFACHHVGPKRVSAEIRSACELFAELFALQIEVRLNAETYERRTVGLRALDQLAARISPENTVFDSLADYDALLTEIIEADGLGVWTGDEYQSVGAAPARAALAPVIARLNTQARPGVFATDELGALSQSMVGDPIAGMIALPISREPRDYLLFFRRELPLTVTWAGDPTKAAARENSDGRLHPRKSFAAWTEAVRGRSRPWGDGDLALGERLRIMLLETLLRRADAAESARKANEERQQVLINELNHRVKNMLGLLRGLVRLGGASASSLEAFVQSLLGRIEALSDSYDQGVATSAESASLRDMVEKVAAPYCAPGGPSLQVAGDDVQVERQAIPTFALMLHELATNAFKYGALSVPTGRVETAWRRSGGELEFSWRERGGPPATPPAETGFGSTLIAKTAPEQMGGRVDLRYEPDGLSFALTAPMSNFSSDAPAPEDVDAGPGLGRIPSAFSALIVEDAAIIALDLEDALIRLGAAEVTIAPSVADALTALDERAYDVAILDYDLNGQTPDAVLARLAQTQARFMFSTGSEMLEALSEKHPAAAILRKPFGADAVAQALREAFASQP